MIRNNPTVDGKYTPLVLIDIGKAKELRCDLQLKLDLNCENGSKSDFLYSSHQ
jgi:hypothetical protein